MADILLKGGKMLNESCPECNAPLFQQDNRIFCAKCGFEKGKTDKERRKAESKASGGPETVGEPAEGWKETLDRAESAVLGKVIEYADRLSSRKESADVQRDLDVLFDLLEMLERIHSVKGSASGPPTAEQERS